MAESASGGRPTLLVAIVLAVMLVTAVSACSGECDTCVPDSWATTRAEQYEKDGEEIQRDMQMQEDRKRDRDLEATSFASDSETQYADYKTTQADNANCNPNYGATHDENGHPAACVPGDRDYDCPELHAMDIGDIDVVGSDWQRLDGRFDFQSQTWTIPPDGVGCEWASE